MKKILSLFALLFVISGCATVARSDYAGDKKYPDIKSAMQHTSSVVQLTPGASRTIKISMDSPLLVSPTSKGRFERIDIKGRKGESFSISVLGICDCLGFRKWAVVPFVYLLDASGTVLAQEGVTVSQGKILFGKFPADGDYVLMIVANSDSEGETIGNLGTSLIPMYLTSHPTGSIGVVWRENVVPAPSVTSGQ